MFFIEKYQNYFISLLKIFKSKLMLFELNINTTFDVIHFFNLTKSRFSYFFCLEPLFIPIYGGFFIFNNY